MNNDLETLLNKMKKLEESATMKKQPIVEQSNSFIDATRELIHSGAISSVDRCLREEYERAKQDQYLVESSPDTIEGSFTDDLNKSKEWLCKVLKAGLKGKNAGTIYVLGSWFGNVAMFIDEAGIKFDKIVLVETDERKLDTSKALLDKLNAKGKIVFIHQKAEDVVYETPGIVINTSCNETGPAFLSNLPKNMLCVLQARNNVSGVVTETNNLKEFEKQFELKGIHYRKAMRLDDPETPYKRFMIIGRAPGSHVKEAKMSPSTFAKAVDQSSYEGVKVGLEFEFCVPIDRYKKAATPLYILSTAVRLDDIFAEILVGGEGDVSPESISPEMMDEYLEINSDQKPKVSSFVDAVEKLENTGFDVMGLPYSYIINKVIYPNRSYSSNFSKLFTLYEGEEFLEILTNITGVDYDGRYIMDNIDEYVPYDLSALFVKEKISSFGEVKIFDEYHQATKDLTSWYVEPDTSIDPKYHSETGFEDGGVELVSPPLPAKQAIQKLNEFYAIAHQNKFYTGEEYGTGIHINISIPKTLDVLKLIAFAGDEHILRQFGRERNEYAISTMNQLKGMVSPEDDMIKDGSLTKFDFDALKAVAAQASQDHYVSISAENDHYISFRHAGGDYLNRQDEILTTIGRFIRAMIIASDPNAYRQEYLKKLSKIVSPLKKQADLTNTQLLRKIANEGVPVIRVDTVGPRKEDPTDAIFWGLPTVSRFGDSVNLLSIAEDQSAIQNVVGKVVVSTVGAKILNIAKNNPDKVYATVSYFGPKPNFDDLKTVYNKIAENSAFYSKPYGKLLSGKHGVARGVLEYLPINNPIVRITFDNLKKTLSAEQLKEFNSIFEEYKQKHRKTERKNQQKPLIPVNETKQLDETVKAPIYYFAYGMLTDPSIMRGFDLIGVGELKNFEYKMYQYANVEPATGEIVYGVLWEVDREKISQLDNIEGYPTLYDRRTYPVYVDGKKYAAEVYIMTPSTRQFFQGTAPDDHYVETVARGYRNAGVPLYQLEDAVELADYEETMYNRSYKHSLYESTTTLTNLYGDNVPDRDESIWDYGDMIWDEEFEIQTIPPHTLELLIRSHYGVEHIDELFGMMTKAQTKLVNGYMKRPDLSDQIIVIDGGKIVDGNHRALAAVKARKPIKYIDIAEEEVEESKTNTATLFDK